MTLTTISNDALEARIDGHGAELCSLRPSNGDEMIWQAGEAWPRHAPILFPIVGGLNQDTFRFEGRSYTLGRHGFARDREFDLAASDASSATFVLVDDDATREVYPFAFRLEIRFALEDDGLATTYKVENTGPRNMFASIGAHPAFRWPLAPGIPKDAHRLVFDTDENGPVRLLDDGLLRHAPVPTPIQGRTLNLTEDLFRDDAIIMQRVGSRYVRYEASGHEAPVVTVGWEGFDRLGLWSRPHGAGMADFLCIEPWSGNADPVGYEGDLPSKPGILRIGPGTSIERRMTIQVTGG